MPFQTRLLDESTWTAYADLIERHNGVWGGCWCMGFQCNQPEAFESVEQKKEAKRVLVATGGAHASLVFDGDLAVGWCQFGADNELCPKRKFRKLYEPGLVQPPDWRITCFFVDRKYRGKGVASLALDGALEAIARNGGGLVEAYPEDVEGRKFARNFIYLGTVPMFEKRGFSKQRKVAMHHWVMTAEIPGTKKKEP